MLLKSCIENLETFMQSNYIDIVRHWHSMALEAPLEVDYLKT